MRYTILGVPAYFLPKKNVQVIDKSRGKYRILKTIGSNSDVSEVERLYQQAKCGLPFFCGDRDMFADAQKAQEAKQVTEYLLNNIENILLNGTQMIKFSNLSDLMQ